MATNVGRKSYPFVEGLARFTGTTTTPVTSSTVGAEFQSYKTACSATSGSSYGVRFSHKITGAAGSGAAIRGYSYAYGVSATYLYGGEFTAEVHDTSADIATAGTLAGIRAVASIQSDATGYTYAGVFNFDVLTSKTASATKSAYLGFSCLGSGTPTIALMNIAATIATDTPDTNLVTTHADHASTHLIRILINDSPMWLLACNAHT
jgi:hypothetical protein